MLFVLSLIGIVVLSYPPARQASATAPALTQVNCKLDYVIDGDTVIADCGRYRRVHIRLFGIDAPESGQALWGERSRQTLIALLAGKEFRLVGHGKGYYHRQLGTLFVGAQDINLAMLEHGQAIAYQGKETPRKYMQAARRAKAAKRGIWVHSGSQQHPKLWRRYHK